MPDMNPLPDDLCAFLHEHRIECSLVNCSFRVVLCIAGRKLPISISVNYHEFASC
jgi:hypothetical protein